MKSCLSCACAECAHFTLGNRPCLTDGCACKGFVEDQRPVEYPPMFSVRIERVAENGKYTFSVESMPYSKYELIALDSTPGVIAFVHAPDPGAACARAWEKGQQELASLGGLPPSPSEKLLELLGDKKPEGGSP